MPLRHEEELLMYKIDLAEFCNRPFFLKGGNYMAEEIMNQEMQEEEAEVCSSCGNIYRIELLKEGEDWNDFGYRHCPFCGLFIDLYA
jgi:formate dehydrogenase maturation protein FdhE